ncbi:PD-(D/E)XK nuclease superfamily protein [Lachnospiraceae bacterium]|nr:PD-(D/E)XK nuclease superfamily protein [Lachnospiraceae bacterium]
MDLVFGVGTSDFEVLRKEKGYYVDKTEILYELVKETHNEVTLFNRPRRFGKTLMMSMFENFFNIRKSSNEIFEGLDITRNHHEFCEEWMNKYPVLFISFKDVEADTYEVAFDKLKDIIAGVCKKNAYIADDERVNPADAEIFQRLMFGNASEAEVHGALKTIMRMLNNIHGKKVILLIDEYDVPLACASEKNSKENRYYARMLDVIKGMLSSSLKDNEFLKFAVVTGCLRIAKESIFTGTNNFVAYSVLDERFSQYFGFSENEVDTLLERAGYEDKSSVVKEWYDGYLFGNRHVYCPWDVINYLSDLTYNSDAKPSNYWKNTSHNGILLTFVQRTEFKVKGKFEALLNGGTIVQTVSDDMTYDTLHSSEDNLWSVLLMTGYVTKANVNDQDDTVSLRIPNKEILSIFKDTVIKLFRKTVNNSDQKQMMSALWSKDTVRAGEIISDFLWKTISYNDYHEDYYHAFLAGIFLGLGYEVESNKEKGLGRPDIVIKDQDNRRMIIIEAKRSNSEAEMEKDTIDAVDQISKRRYYEADDFDGYKERLCFGIAFFKKKAMVKLMVK